MIIWKKLLDDAICLAYISTSLKNILLWCLIVLIYMIYFFKKTKKICIVLFLRVEVWMFWNGKNWSFMLLACHACIWAMTWWPNRYKRILIMPPNSFICIHVTFPRSYYLPTLYSGPPGQFSGPYLEMIRLYKFSISFMHGAICFCLLMHTYAHLQLMQSLAGKYSKCKGLFGRDLLDKLKLSAKF